MPKCVDADWTPPPKPRRLCGWLRPEPEPSPPPVLTWQIAKQSVGGVCKKEPPPPGMGVDERAEEERAG